MESLRQYEIWWAELPPPAGRRPVLLLSRNDAYQYLPKFAVAEITTNIRSIAVEVLVGPAEGLPKKCAVNCDNIRMVAKSTLTARVGRLDVNRSTEVKRAVGAAFGWRELTDLE